jgi:hypothetical protein
VVGGRWTLVSEDAVFKHELNLPEVIVQFLQAVLPEDMAPAGEQ